MRPDKIIALLPYRKPFKFVDELHHIDSEGVEGSYTFHQDHGFYQGHFKDHPVTPGVILTECCAQIGLVCQGIFLLSNLDSPSGKSTGIALSSTQMDFYRPVYPGERVRVLSKKVYFRFGKLQSQVHMYNADNALICKGVLSGMIKSKEDE